jgi:hypothetical protein
MKCAEDHPTFECQKEKTTPVKCPNCNAEHKSINKNSPMRPKENFQKKTWKPVEERRKPETTTKKSKKEEITQEIAAMMVEFAKAKPTKTQTSTPE